MPGLIRGIARTAVVAGTATAVSNRVSRRQAGRWAAEDQSHQQPYMPPPPGRYQRPMYQPPPWRYQQQPVYEQPPPPAPASVALASLAARAVTGQLEVPPAAGADAPH
jgi:hypothetical protein